MPTIVPTIEYHETTIKNFLTSNCNILLSLILKN